MGWREGQYERPHTLIIIEKEGQLISNYMYALTDISHMIAT